MIRDRPTTGVEVTEQDQVRFGATTVDYTIKRSRRRRKTVEITLDPVEGVLVAAPARASRDTIHDIVRRRARWIVRHSAAEVLRPRRKQFVSGESLPYLGRQVRMTVTPAPGTAVLVRFDHWSFQIAAPDRLEGEARRDAIERALTRWYQARAVEWLGERVRRWSALCGHIPRAVLVRSQRQRWGSYGADGTLRFNWRIIMAPPALIDYVMVHELVHLQIRNHSPEFWAGVARLMPDYRTRRARLKELGPSLVL